MNIMNIKGKQVTTARSDAEAARWFLDNGHKGDYLEDTGEPLGDIALLIFEDAEWGYDAVGNVVTTVHPS
jgi:hypothetical protein